MQKQLIGHHSLLRDLNYRAVFEHLATQGPLSRTDGARDLNLSLASVSRMVDGLLTANLVVEGERIASRAGRRQTLLDINSQAATVAGLSIRSRSVRLLLANLKGDPLKQLRVERRNDTPDALVAQVKELVLSAQQDCAPGIPIGAVVVGISGAWDEHRNQVHAAPNLELLEGVDALTLLKQSLGPHIVAQTVSIDNDINHAALGEHHHGAAKGTPNFFYINVGSGVGGAAVVNGQLHRGVMGFAGEIGYLPVWSDGNLQTLETLIGRKAINRYAAEAGFMDTDEILLEQLEHHHPAAEAVAERVSSYLSIALTSVVTILNPQMIVLGGSIGRYGDYWTDAIRRHMERLTPAVPRLVSTALGRDASLLGAVAYGLTLARQALISEELML